MLPYWLTTTTPCLSEKTRGRPPYSSTRILLRQKSLFRLRLKKHNLNVRNYRARWSVRENLACMQLFPCRISLRGSIFLKWKRKTGRLFRVESWSPEKRASNNILWWNQSGRIGFIFYGLFGIRRRKVFATYRVVRWSVPGEYCLRFGIVFLFQGIRQLI